MIAETSKLLGTSHYLFYFILFYFCFILTQNEFINVLYSLTLFNIFHFLFPLGNSVLILPVLYICC